MPLSSPYKAEIRRASSPIGDLVRTRDQIVHATNPVGEPVTSNVVANEQSRLVCVLVIAATFELGSAELVIPVLHALALSHRVDRQDKNSCEGELGGPRVGMHLGGCRLGLGLRCRLRRWVRSEASATKVLGDGQSVYGNQQNCE